MILPPTMQAMVLELPGKPLQLKTLPLPVPGIGQVLVKVLACGVCRTDLHIMDGELKHPKLPLIPGHEIVGEIVQCGPLVKRFHEGEFVGIPWLGYTCGTCRYCIKGRENLCENAGFTGYTIDGGYAQFAVADQQYCFPLAASLAKPSTAPWFCAGLIGYRAYSMIGKDVEKIGIYGFGAAAHLLIQVAIHEKKKIFAFTRKGDKTAQEFAIKLGASWAGDSEQPAPQILDAAIIFAPDGSLVPKALADIDKGGTVVCGGIHMSDIPDFSYDLLWNERIIRSVANLTREDAENFLAIAPLVPLLAQVQPFALHQANEALADLRNGKLRGAAVLIM